MYTVCMKLHKQKLQTQFERLLDYNYFEPRFDINAIKRHAMRVLSGESTREQIADHCYPLCVYPGEYADITPEVLYIEEYMREIDNAIAYANSAE